MLPNRLKHPVKLEWQKIKGMARGGFFALNDLDKKLLKYLDYNDGYFVELGANDGQSQSNTYYFELRRNWRGVLIEPIPHRFIECKRLRGQRSKVFCAACVPFDYSEPFVPMRYADLMTIAEPLSILDIDSRMDDAAPHYNAAESYRFAAEARTISSILDEAGAPPEIDLLSLDVEGAELAVIGGLDLNQYRFKYMLIETVGDPSDLPLTGYEIIDQFSNWDYLFMATPKSE